jgi:hypothetical protein
MAKDILNLLSAESVVILKKAKDKYKNIFFKEMEIAPFIRDVSARFDGGAVKLNLKLSASINQTHPHINPESIITLLKDRFNILVGDPVEEEYNIMRTRIYFEDGMTDFR